MREGWKVYHIEDFGAISTGTTPSTRNPEYYGGDYKFISPADLDNGKYISTSHKFITDEGLTVSRTLPKYAILVGCIGNIGKIGMTIDEVSAFNQQINAIVCNKNFLPDFIYYLLIHNKPILEKSAVKTTLPILNKGNFQKIKLEVPELPEQRKIAYILSTVQKAIEQQDKLIRHTTELKKALMQKLFTEGLPEFRRKSGYDGEKQKQTEIGCVPQSWEIKSINQITVGKFQNGAFVQNPSKGKGLLFANVVDMYRGIYLDFSKLEKLNVTEKEISQYILKENDILFVRSSLKREGIGQNCVVKNIPETTFYDCHIIKIKPNEEVVVPEFLSFYFSSAIGKEELIKRSKTTTMTTINQKSLGSTLIPLPNIDEQKEIVRTGLQIDKKILIHEKQKQTLFDFFKTLLHELMTGQRRVHEIEFEAFSKTYKIKEQPLSMVAEK